MARKRDRNLRRPVETVRRGSAWKGLWAVALFLCVSLFAAPSRPSHRQKPSSPRPNVVLIITDDMRWDCMSCVGHPYLKTPNLDRLAAEGVLFTNAFVTTSLCSPSRASILSGLYAHAHGVLNNFTDFPRDLPNFPRQLHEAGYETAYIGKWHMGEDNDEPRPWFDFWASHKGQGKYFDNVFNINGVRRMIPGYYTKVVTDLAVSWLRMPRNKPFLLILGHKAPHTPYTPEPKYAHLFDGVEVNYPHSAFRLEGKPKWIWDRLDTWHGIYGPLYGFRKKFPDRSAAAVLDFDRFVKSYWATIKSIDDSVGRIYECLQEIGQLDNTLIIFTSDNGMFLGEHGMTDKRSMHEPSIRVPLIVRPPAWLRHSRYVSVSQSYMANIAGREREYIPPRPGRIIKQQVLNIDIAPSILDICGVPPLPKVHGRSWKPLLEASNPDKVPWRDAWLYEYNYEKQFPYTPNVRGIRTADWKYMHYPHGDGTPDRYKAELYNLRTDPNEMHNLIDDPRYDWVVKRLKARLHELQKETGGLPDRMPVEEGVKKELPAEEIR